MLSYTGGQQITLSKPKLCVIGLMGTIADFAVKAIQLQMPLQTSQVIDTFFSINWTVFDRLNDNWGKLGLFKD